MRVVTSEQMKQLEQAALHHDLTFHRLMENAGSAAAAFIRRTFKVENLNCMIFCGSGNNGGDGLVVARKLFENEANVLIVLVGGVPSSEEGIAMYNMAELMNLPILSLETSSEKIFGHMQSADIIVDAIYGTGFHGKLGELPAKACKAINDAIAAVVSLDIPSGVVCDSGSADPNAVKADFTVAFDSLKPLHILPVSLSYCGMIETVDIGIPHEARNGIESRFGVINTDMVFEQLPPRARDAHKSTHGTLLSICGSAQYRGAAVLSTLGALRCGVGKLTLASIEPVCAAVSANVYEATYLPLPANELGTISSDEAIAALDGPLAAASCVLFGCGVGNNAHTARLLAYLLQHAKSPLVIDADGINALAENIHVLKDAKTPVILTPHSGELSRLCGVPVAQIEDDRYAIAMQFADRYKVILVLKGPETIIAAPEGGLFINQTGNPGLAKGGSGDVLAGMVAAFAAQGVEPAMAAVCAVHLHGLAADKTAARLSQYAMLPSELLVDLTAIFAEHQR